MGPGAMNIQTPLVKQALQYMGPDGKPTAMPMYDFENAVRKDPRWLQTDNAQDSFMSNAHRVLQDFGFAYAGLDPRLAKEIIVWLLWPVRKMLPRRLYARVVQTKQRSYQGIQSYGIS